MSTDEFERGKKAGRIDALLAEHTAHLARINGSIDKSATANEHVAGAMRELAGEIRSLQEDGRIAIERVKVAAETLAAETEWRRKELATTAEKGDRSFSKRERIAAILVSLVVGAAGLYLKFH